MEVIGITGGVGSGKSRVSDILQQEYGAKVIQTDLVAKKLMEPGHAGYEGLLAVYGPELLAEDKTIDRGRLSKRMFGDPTILSEVNRIIHPLVWDMVRRMIKESESSLTVVETALPDKNHRDIYTELWYVYTSEENRMARLKKNRGYSRQKSRGIMDSQPTDGEFRAMADAVIDNNGSLEETQRQIAVLRHRRKA